jgi:hypothetical protein
MPCTHEARSRRRNAKNSFFYVFKPTDKLQLLHGMHVHLHWIAIVQDDTSPYITSLYVLSPYETSLHVNFPTFLHSHTFHP